jgi:hypothetical protein
MSMLRCFTAVVVISSEIFICDSLRLQTLRSDTCKFVLGWSAGHEGTTFLSSQAPYLNASHVDFKFENENLLKGWADDTPFCHNRNLEHVDDWHRASRKAAEMNLAEWSSEMESKGKTVGIDLGHHVCAGCLWFDAYAEHRDVCVARIMRNPLLTALSFNYTFNHGLSCEVHSAKWSICPSNDSVLMLQPEVWSQLNDYQRWLWMTDELEARWQKLLERVPRLQYHHVQVEWDQEFAEEHVVAITSLLGEGVEVNPDRLTHVAKHHVPTADRPSYPTLIAEAKSYERLVNYPSHQMKLLAHRQRNFENFYTHSSD